MNLRKNGELQPPCAPSSILGAGACTPLGCTPLVGAPKCTPCTPLYPPVPPLQGAGACQGTFNLRYMVEDGQRIIARLEDDKQLSVSAGEA